MAQEYSNESSGVLGLTSRYPLVRDAGKLIRFPFSSLETRLYKHMHLTTKESSLLNPTFLFLTLSPEMFLICSQHSSFPVVLRPLSYV